MKKIFIKFILLLSVISILISCEEPAEDINDSSKDNTKYDEQSVVWEGSREIKNWWANDDVILQCGEDPEQFKVEANALQITFTSKVNPQFKIANRKDWSVNAIEVVRGNGALYGEDRVDLVSNKSDGVVICKVSEETMSLFAQSGLLIFGNDLTITKVSLVNDTSTKPGNVKLDPLDIPPELKNDIVVWEGTQEVQIHGVTSFTFKNVENYSSDANALRITYSANCTKNAPTMQLSPAKAEYSMGKGYSKSDYVVLDQKAVDSVIVVKVSEEDINYFIRCGLEISPATPVTYTISRIVLTKFEETTIFEGEHILGWGDEDALKFESQTIPKDARAIIVSFTKTKPEENTAIIKFSDLWWQGKRVYCASGNSAVIPGYESGNEDLAIYPLTDQGWGKVANDTKTTAFVFTADDFKSFSEIGLLLTGQDIKISKIKYMKFSENGPEEKQSE